MEPPELDWKEDWDDAACLAGSPGARLTHISAADLRAGREAALRTPEVREELTARLQREIDLGTFDCETERLAEKLLSARASHPRFF